LDALIPRAAGCDEGHPVPVERREPLAEALLTVCQVAREEGFGHGIELILQSDRANGNVLLAVCLYEHGWASDRPGILKVLEQFDGLPARPHAFDPNAPCQVRVWEAVRSMLGHILPWYPAGRTIPSWHPDTIEANRLQAKLSPQLDRFSAPTTGSMNEATAPPESPLTIPDRSDPPAVALEPDVQAILDKAREREAQAAQLQREYEEGQARWRRAHEAWLRVARFRVDAIPSDPPGDGRLDRYVELIMELGRVLEADGWRARVEAVTPGSEAKTYALKMLLEAMDGDITAVNAMVRAGVKTLFSLGLEASSWLHRGLMLEVLGIQPAPEPPLGWEGAYLDSVDTMADFVKWVEGELLTYDGFFSGRGSSASDGSLVRNAFRLVGKLGLKGMPLEPPGPFTLDAELAVLRNLLRLCRERQEEESTAAGSDEGNSNRAEQEKKPVTKGSAGSTKRRKRGRPADTDTKADKRIYEAWKSQRHKTYADLALALGITTRTVKEAIDRHRQRLKRLNRG
jgi:hypothetical protein